MPTLPRSLSQPAEGDRILLLAPHPDDESLAAGGALARAARRGAALRVVFATDGDNAPWIQRVFERRWRIGAVERARFGVTRRREGRAALAALGLDACQHVFLGEPDQGACAALLHRPERFVALLQAEIEAFKPNLLLAPSLFDLHPDHSALAVLLRLACARLLPEAPLVLSFVIHQRREPPAQIERVEVRLAPEESARKRKAVLCYASQLSVHSKRFQGYQTGHERFLREPRLFRGGAPHPLREACWRQAALHLRLEPSACIGALGPVTLCLLVQDPAGELEAFLLPLARATDEHELVPLSAGAARLGAGARRRAHGWDVVLRPAAPRSWLRLWAKLERRFGFFDEAGWFELPVGPEETTEERPEDRPGTSRAAAALSGARRLVAPGA